MTSTRVGSLNVLGGHHTAPGGKNADLPDAWFRQNQIVNFANAQGITLLAMQETELPQVRVTRKRPRWNATRTVNQRLRQPWDGIGNSCAWRSDIWQLRKARVIRVHISEGRTLHQSFVRLKHRETGFILGLLSAHNPSSGPISGGTDADRQKCERIEDEFCRSRSFPVVAGADVNRFGFRPASGRLGIQSEVVALWSYDIAISQTRTHWETRQRGWSDHAMISGRINF